MAELVDAADLKSADRKVVGVQVPLRALCWIADCLIRYHDDGTDRFCWTVVGHAKAVKAQRRPGTTRTSPCSPSAAQSLTEAMGCEIGRGLP